jgi:hypothetical protein
MSVWPRLSNRRPHEELIDFDFGGIRYKVGIGRFDDGAVAEIFLNTAGKVGTHLEMTDGGAAAPFAAIHDLVAGP